ncbi:TonB-dependent receptor [Aestuariibacter sp. A3R04]|uniref:TonB-dependent receptor n=1 Tax=Aestuariibacter sp. A3R04 TaxID=2841571 RepID=UPI001C08D477|nr:TonB-dependent receptor [Aestuariibacter sp. A3R04]MBU3020420.1 TonB-dependent receptor [Aestuariibacter sp. A3R04]
MHNTQSHVNRKLLGNTAALLLTISSPTLLAQEVNSAIDNAAAAAERKLPNEDIEVIEVSGVRDSLEDALNTKRNAPSIVDAISATDIDALPALDFGEALQAIPGVQLNSDEEGRQSTISLRGLGSGFVKTTAFGQSFATPSSANNINSVGEPNPFAAFEASIFDGVTIIKSPTADLQAGGIAGTVDQQLQQALSKKDGILTFSAGGRYEDLTGNVDPNVRIAGVKHLMDNKLGVAFKLAGSGQTFRRDTFDIIDYTSVDTVDGDVRATNIAEYREKWGLPDDAQLTAPARGRNVSEYSDGDRVSFSGNIEYRVADHFKLGAHLLFSERDLADGTKEASTFSPGFNTNRRDRDHFDGRVTLDMDTAPFAYDRTADEQNAPLVYAVSAYDFTNGALQTENRKTTFREKTQGIILYGDYYTENWAFDGKITRSDATNEFQNVGFTFLHDQDWRSAFNFTDAEGRRTGVESIPTGFNGSINSGNGNLDDIVVQGQLEQPYVYNDLVWQIPNLSSASINSVSDANQGRRLSFRITGRVRDLSRDVTSAEFNAERYTDFGFGDKLNFETIKFGARFSRESLESIDQRQGLAGVDTSNISDAFLTDNVLSSSQNDYFGGNIPGTFDNTSGWLTIDNALALEMLQRGIETDVNNIPTATTFSTPYPELERNRTGFWDTQDRNSGLPSNIGYNFEAEQDIFAIYAMSDFAGEFGPVMYRGNIGVRHIQTDNTFDGFETQVDDQGRNGIASPVTFEDDYQHTLPMANITFELREDLLLRAAYYEGIVRPNLLAQRPTAALRGGNQSVRLDLPTATVRPYEATNYDLSLEWYNREGSAISIGYFKKDITNLFDTEEGFCPDPGTNNIVDNLLGDIERTPGTNGREFGCVQTTPIIDDDGNENFREVNITAPINVSDTITVTGYELAIQQKLDFLPYPWNGFGGVFNYTSLDQEGSEVELTRVSPESFNVITYWENDGISLRLSYNWRDDQTLKGANSFLGTNSRTRAAIGRLDFVGSYAINKKTKVFLRAFNLTDEVGKEYLGTDERAVSRLTYTGRIYQLAVNYRF